MEIGDESNIDKYIKKAKDPGKFANLVIELAAIRHPLAAPVGPGPASSCRVRVARGGMAPWIPNS